MAQKEGAEAKSAQKKSVWLTGSAPIRLYVVNACTEGDFDAACDDPRSLVEGGMDTMASPDMLGVFSMPGLALEAGIHWIMTRMKEEWEQEDPVLPGLSELLMAHWVNENEEPYDDSCPLEQSVFTEDCFHDKDHPDIGKPMGRPYYVVYLKDPNPVRTTPYSEGYLACVVVQELTLDEQEVY